MIRLLILILTFTISTLAQELLVVGDKNFPKDSLSKKEIKAIFLDKKRLIDGKRILAMNHSISHPLRSCFEKNILNKSQKSLERYWRKAFYKGKRPPKIITSGAMLLSYFTNVHPSIGYINSSEILPEGTKILYRIGCK